MNHIYGAPKLINHQLSGLVALMSWATLLVLPGCATIYKSTAGDYVDAAKQIGPTLASADAALRAVDNARKRNLIARDRMCPVERSNALYLLPKALGIRHVAPDFFSNLIKTADITASNCKALKQCEKRGNCGTICYHAMESSCIDELLHYYNMSAASPEADPTIVADKKSLDSLIVRIGYGAPSGQDYLAQGSLNILSAYLDLLGKAADGQTKNFRSNAKSLAKQVQSVTSTYKSLTGEDLLSKQPLRAATGSITAFGALLDDIVTMARTAKDTASIKAAVLKDNQNADDATKEIQKIVIADLQTVASRSMNEATRKRRVLEKTFQMKTTTQEERRLILIKLSEISPENASQLIAAARVVFKKARESNDTLVQLVKNPSDKQLQQARAEEFASFRAAAGDLVSLIAVLK